MDKLEALKAVERFDAEIEIHGGESFAVWSPAPSGSHVLAKDYDQLLAALEEKDQRIKDLEDSAALDQYRIKTLEALADQNDKQRDHWMERANAAEQRLQQPIKLPELDSDLIDILGRPNFACIRTSQRLRELGYEIKRRSENEQAATLHFLLSHYLADSTNWRDTAEIALRGNAAKVEGE